MTGFFLQILWGTTTTLEVAFLACAFGLSLALLTTILELMQIKWLYRSINSLLFVVRGLPELFVLFFLYFGSIALLNRLFHHYIDVNPLVASVLALGLIFAAYAAQTLRGAFLAVLPGQLEAGKAMGLSSVQLFLHIHLPQAWRHALPGLSNLWLVLLKDTAIVTLIGLSDIMNQAKLAANATQQPFTYYFFAALIYLLITYVSQLIFSFLQSKSNECIASC